MPAFDGGPFAAHVQVVLTHRAFAEGQIEGRRQTPAPVTPETPREVLGMVIPIVEEHIEDSACVGLLHFALVARQETGSPQERFGLVGGLAEQRYGKGSEIGIGLP